MHKREILIVCACGFVIFLIGAMAGMKYERSKWVGVTIGTSTADSVEYYSNMCVDTAVYNIQSYVPCGDSANIQPLIRHVIQ